MMDLPTLLDNLVCRDIIFSFLEVNNLLRLRRVCKSLKIHSSDFIRLKKVESKQELKVNFCDDNPFERLSKFQKRSRNLPIRTMARIENLGFWKKWGPSTVPLKTLAETFGKNLTHLTFTTHTYGHISCRKSIYNYLPNVTHFTVQTWYITEDWNYTVPRTDQLSASFKKLKSLKIVGDFALEKDPVPFLAAHLGENISTLVQLELPYDFWMQVLRVAKTKQFKRFARMCLFDSPILKLFNVHGKFIKELLKPKYHTAEFCTMDTLIENINSKVMSIKNPTTLFLEFTHLESISFSSSWEPNEGQVVVRNLPNLKKISIGFTSCIYNWRKNVLMWHILCIGIRRENVVEMDIRLISYYEQRESDHQSEDVLTSCPNLRKLTIGFEVNKALDLPKLWRGLTFLEELQLYRCSDITDVDFVGEDSANPAFLQLKNLKILEFTKMRMEITDELLSQVICHMPLKKFVMSSFLEIRLITLNGIMSLLNGEFAKAIETFPLNNLKLKNVKCQHNVENLFRSSRMN